MNVYFGIALLALTGLIVHVGLAPQPDADFIKGLAVIVGGFTFAGFNQPSGGA